MNYLERLRTDDSVDAFEIPVLLIQLFRWIIIRIDTDVCTNRIHINVATSAVSQETFIRNYESIEYKGFWRVVSIRAPDISVCSLILWFSTMQTSVDKRGSNCLLLSEISRVKCKEAWCLLELCQSCDVSRYSGHHSSLMHSTRLSTENALL